MSRPLLGQVSYVTTHLTVLVVSVILLAAFSVQFRDGEFPCPLCILQRMAMILAVVGPLQMILMGHRHKVIDSEMFATGWGMTVLAALLGGVS